MKRFKLNLQNKYGGEKEREYWSDKFEEISNLKRKFQSINVDLTGKDGKNPLELFTQISLRHGSQIKDLSIRDCEFKSCQQLCNILKTMPQLNSLRISHLALEPSHSDDESVVPVLLKHLKKLMLYESNFAFLQCFNAPKLEDLSFHYVYKSFFHPSAIEILKSSRCLQSFDLYYSSEKFFMAEPFELFPFKLKKLSVKSWHIPQVIKEKFEANFKKFLKSQGSFIEDLKLWAWVSPEIYESIFSDFKRLKKLHLDTSALPSDKNFYGKLHPIATLEEFYACEFRDDFEAQGILQNCPNLKRFVQGF